MKVFDAHIHLDSKKFPKARDAAKNLNSELIKNNVERAVVIHLNIQKWKVNEFVEIKDLYNLHNIYLRILEKYFEKI